MDMTIAVMGKGKKAMTDNEIIEALELCHTQDGKIPCYDCPCWDDGMQKCEGLNHDDLLGLINRQKAEIERLQKETNLVSIQFQDLQERINDIKAEAYKEFAKKLNTEIKKAYINNLEVFGEHLKNHKDTPDFEFLSTITGKENALRGLCNFINNLLKEMVGEK